MCCKGMFLLDFGQSVCRYFPVFFVRKQLDFFLDIMSALNVHCFLVGYVHSFIADSVWRILGLMG